MEGVTLLTLDDDRLFNKILSKFLRDLNISHKTTESVEDFSVQMRKKKYDLYLIDLNLDNAGDGFKVISRIRSVGNSTPIIVISAQKDSSEITHAIELGANDYLVKPLDKTMLGSKLKDYFSSKRLDNISLGLRRAPENGIHAEVDFKLNAKKIDEYGMEIESNHLLLKEVSIDLNVGKLLGHDDSFIKSLVKKNWVVEKKELFGAYLEFDQGAEKTIAKIRTWLMTRKNRGGNKTS